MAAFDPKAFLAETQAATPTAGEGFDPKAFLAQTVDPDAPSELESGARGLAQGATLGFADEIAGGAEALLDKLKGAHEALGELYVKHRDESRKNFKKAEEANPNAFGAGKLAGGIGSQAALALATGGTSIPEQMALGAAGGGLNALGEAPELDKDTAGQVAIGTLGGAAAGGIGAGLGKLASKGLNALGGGIAEAAGAKEAAAAEQLAQRGAQEAAETTATARGTAGKAIADANATLRTLRESLSDPGVSAERKQAITDFLQSDAGAQLRESVVGNALEAAPEKVGAAENAKALYKAAAEAEPDEAKRLADYYGSPKYLGQQALDRAKRYGPRALTGLLGMGHGVGGIAEGAALGQIAGPAKDSLRRLAVLPGAQKMAFGAFKKVGQALQTNPDALGKYGAVLARAASEGPQQLAAAHYALAQKSPEYQERLKKLDEEGTPEELAQQ